MGSQKQAEGVRVATGKSLECIVCQHTRFWKRSAQLNTRLATFVQLEWVNPSATCYICDRCGYVHWFMKRQQGQEMQEP